MKLHAIFVSGVLAAGSVAAASSAHAGTVFSDNFDSDAAVLNWSGDSVFTSIPAPGNVYGMPSVDLVGVGDGFGYLAYEGNSVDLDGTTGYNDRAIAGELQSTTSLSQGNYTVQFVLAGNLRGAAAQTTRVEIGSVYYDLNPATHRVTCRIPCLSTMSPVR